jgi:hypothetical protein
MKPEIKHDKKDHDENERRVVPFVPRLSYRSKPVFQIDLTDDRSDTSNRRRPEEILDSYADFLVEVEQRRRCPILRDKEKARERQRRRDERAPADLRPVGLTNDGADDPSYPENKDTDEVGVVIAR